MDSNFDTSTLTTEPSPQDVTFAIDVLMRAGAMVTTTNDHVLNTYYVIRIPTKKAEHK